MQRGKKYQDAVKLIEKDKNYPPTEAIALAKKAASAKFDETVELHMRTGLDPRHADGHEHAQRRRTGSRQVRQRARRGAPQWAR